MREISFHYYPKLELEFTVAEVDNLLLCSKTHYDGACCRAGVFGGFLYGLKNLVEVKTNRASNFFSLSELDLLCKITENPLANDTLHSDLRKATKKLSEEYNRLNQKVPACTDGFFENF